ncbi:hypothetical protein ACWEPB_02470 [Kitasatospora cineracea]
MVDRSRLHDPETLRWVMQHPGRGEPYTVRTLAKAADCNPATIGHLLAGRQESTAKLRAERIARALGCSTRTLFMSAASTDSSDPYTESSDKE